MWHSNLQSACRHTGCSSVVHAASSIQHGHEQLPTYCGLAYRRHQTQQEGLSLLLCVACQTPMIGRSLKTRVWHFVAKKPIVIGTVTVLVTIAVACATVVFNWHHK